MAYAELRDAGAGILFADMRRSVLAPGNAIATLKARRHAGRFNLIHGHSSIGGAVARVASALGGPPVVYTPNGVLTGRFVIAVERRLARFTDLTIAVSPSEAALLRSLKLPCDGRLAVVPNGIDLSQPRSPFDLRSAIGVPQETPIILCIARLVAQKAPLDAVQAMLYVHMQRPDAHLVIVGDGPLAAEVDATIQRLNLAASVHRLNVSRDAAGLLPQADVALLTSRYEGGPYVVLEAYRAGVPIVATSCVGTVDLIDDRVTGLLAPPGDFAGLGTHINSLLNDSSLTASITDTAYRRLIEQYDVQLMATRLSQLYESLTRRERVVVA